MTLTCQLFDNAAIAHSQIRQMTFKWHQNSRVAADRSGWMTILWLLNERVQTQWGWPSDMYATIATKFSKLAQGLFAHKRSAIEVCHSAIPKKETSTCDHRHETVSLDLQVAHASRCRSQQTRSTCTSRWDACPKKLLTLQPLRGSRRLWCSSLSVHGTFWVALVLHTDWRWTQPRLVLHVGWGATVLRAVDISGTVCIGEYVSNNLLNSINSIEHNCPIPPKCAVGSQPSTPQQEFRSLNWPTVAVSRCRIVWRLLTFQSLRGQTYPFSIHDFCSAFAHICWLERSGRCVKFNMHVIWRDETCLSAGSLVSAHSESRHSFDI